MKNLHLATNNELEKLLTLAIGRVFRLCAQGDAQGALKAKQDALVINDEIKARA